MTRLSLLLGITCVAIVASCTKAPPPPPDTRTADEAAIRGETDRYLKAFNAGDMKSMESSYTDDAVLMSPDGPPIVGKAAILADYTKKFAENTVTQEATVDEVAVFGDVGMSRGTWQVTQTAKKAKAKPEIRHGKWFVMHKRDGGAWKTWRWMWNQDQSVAPRKK